MNFYPYFGDKEYFHLLRVGGAGLGNLLFPLARSLKYSSSAEEGQARFLEPIWPTFKLGPIIRRELDSRFYRGLFQSNLKQRLGVALTLYTTNLISEDEFLSGEFRPGEKLTVIVKDLRNYFEDIQGYEDVILRYLTTNISKSSKTKVDTFDTNAIGVHIRMGDYATEWRTDIKWYIEQVTALQEVDYYKKLPVYVFSDGKDIELQELLQLPSVKRVENPDALSDILRLSKCEIIVGSNSSFSAWAAFLGKAKFIRPPHFYMGRLRGNSELIEIDSTAELFT